MPGTTAQHVCYARRCTTAFSGEYIRSCRHSPHLAFEHKSQRASLDLFHAWVFGGVGENDAWSPRGEKMSGTPGQCRRQLGFQDILASAAPPKPNLAPGHWKLQRLAKGLSIPELLLGYSRGSRCIKKGKRFPLLYILFTADILHGSAWNHLPHTTTNIGAVEQFFYHPHKIRHQETQSLIITKQKTYKQKNKC